MGENGKRNSEKEMEGNDRQKEGVGGRHRKRPRRTGGAGYLDIYTNLEPQVQKNRARDPRLDQLRRVGLDWRWVRIAESVGYDTFVQMWVQITEMFSGERSYIRVQIPPVGKLFRFQRDMVIQQLTEQGDGPKVIREKLKGSLGIDMTEQAIVKVRGKLQG